MWNGRKFRMREHAYQFAKLPTPSPDQQDASEYKRRYEEQYLRVNTMSAAEVKRWGQPKSFEKLGFTMRPDWETVKYDIMMAIVCDYFFRHRPFRAKLLATGDKYLEETNSWKDKTWGVCQGQGKNWLGKILMKVRELWKPLT